MQRKKTYLFTKVFFIALFSLALITCSKDDKKTDPQDDCPSRDPLNELPWLKAIISDNSSPQRLYGGARIYSYILNNAKVFYIWNPASTVSARNVYDCSGKLITASTAPKTDWDVFSNNRTSEVLLWHKPICGAMDPVTELGWLKNIISDNVSPQQLYGGARVYAYEYKGAYVLYVSNPASLIAQRSVYSCDGTLILGPSASRDAWDEFRNNRTRELLLWTRPICGVTDPINELAWLKNIIENGFPSRGSLLMWSLIYSYVYKGNPVFYMYNPFGASGNERVYNCNGDLIIESHGAPVLDSFYRERTREVVLWGKDLCTFNRIPVKELPWLKNIINSNQLNPGARIFTYVIDDGVFTVGNMKINIWNPGSSSPELLYDCDGNLVLEAAVSKDLWDEFRRKRRLETLIWSKD